MANLLSVQGELELSLLLLGKSFDPFQKDLEWFDYEVAVGRHDSAPTPADPDPAAAPGAKHERRVARGKINRKDFNALLRGLDALLRENQPLRFEPYDLNFYFEWSRETPSVYLLVVWFDLALIPRSFTHRFPTAHAGFRFLADKPALQSFRAALEREFISGEGPGGPKPSALIH